jgi:hypothetical protein
MERKIQALERQVMSLSDVDSSEEVLKNDMIFLFEAERKLWNQDAPNVKELERKAVGMPISTYWRRIWTTAHSLN